MIKLFLSFVFVLLLSTFCFAQPFIVAGPCARVETFKVYVDNKPVEEYMPETNDSLVVDIKGLGLKEGFHKIKIVADNPIGESDPIEFWLTINENRKRTIYKIVTMDKIARIDPTYLSAFNLNELVIEIKKTGGSGSSGFNFFGLF
jgi:hypothetical protein